VYVNSATDSALGRRLEDETFVILWEIDTAFSPCFDRARYSIISDQYIVFFTIICFILLLFKHKFRSYFHR
jgi:hypothetical protein